MLDLEDESNFNMVFFYREELDRLVRGLAVPTITVRLLRRKGLITIQDKRHSQYKLSALAQKLLEEAEP
jgi:uncharacterized membrane-anchored protein